MSLKQKTERTSATPTEPSPSSSKHLKPRDWACLPHELTAAILSRLGWVEILVSAQRVCTAWRRVCKHPSMWRSIEIRNPSDLRLHGMDYDLGAMCLRAVKLSQGDLEEISIECFGTDSLLMDIAVRSSNLRRLRLVHCYSISDEGLNKAITKLPLLEHLEFSYCSFSRKTLGAVGHSCPLLHTLKFSRQERSPHCEDDDDALAVAENMPALHYLQLFGSRLTDKGLCAILDGCPHLEHLDLRQCLNVEMEGNLKQRCCERIKDLRQPNDPTDDYEFDAFFEEMVLSNAYEFYGYRYILE